MADPGGHELRTFDVHLGPAGWWAVCECGEEFRAERKSLVIDAWHAHRDEVSQDSELA